MFRRVNLILFDENSTKSKQYIDISVLSLTNLETNTLEKLTLKIIWV